MHIFGSSFLSRKWILFILICLCEARGRTSNTRRVANRPNRPPTFTYCPSSWTVRTTFSKLPVTWTVPRATDDNSVPTVTQTSGPTPGSLLEAGTYQVEYTAEDDDGRKALSCSFDFTVDVISCPDTSQQWHNCTDDLQGGSSCSVSCQPGGATIQCDSGTRQWSPFPTYEDSLCDVIPTSDGRLNSCADGTGGGSLCTFSCRSGNLQSGGAMEDCNVETLEWSSNDFDATSQRKICGPRLDNPVSGLVSCFDGNNFLSVCTYDCIDGLAVPDERASTGTCDEQSGEPTCSGGSPP